MAKGTVTRKKLLKEPDQFITFSGKMIEFGRSHGKSILIGTGVIVVLLLILVSARQISNRNESKASALLEKAMIKYSAALTDTNPEEAYAEVKEDFTSFFDKYGSKASGKLALILYGDISYTAKDADTAIDMYDRALKAFGDTTATKNIILSRLSHAYLLQDKHHEAIQTFENSAVVFVPADEKDTFMPVPVVTGNENNGWIEIAGNIHIGEPVVTAGAFHLMSTLTSKTRSADHHH